MEKRIIKFRVWEETDSRMLDVNEMSHDAFNIVMFHDIILKGKKSFKTGGKTYSYTAMQSIGLSDKNGKEIYEGDIVRPLGASANIGVVEYQSLNDSAYPINGFIANAKGDWLNIWPSAEVLGNIYENSDLLKKD